MLETPQDFARFKQPPSFTSVSSGSMLHRPTIATEKSAADAPVSGSSAGTGAVTAAPPPSDFSSVSSFLEGLWASTSREPAGQLTVAPSSIVSNALAPLSFGAEPHSWPLQRLDKDFVNAAFQLAPAVVPSPHNTNVGPEVAASRSASGLGKTSSRSQSTVRSKPLNLNIRYVCGFHTYSFRIRAMLRSFMCRHHLPGLTRCMTW
jgi:hypothetical protein